MTNVSIEELLGQETYYEDDHIRELFKDLSQFPDSFASLPDPLSVDITTYPPQNPGSTVSIASANAGSPDIENLLSGDGAPDQRANIPNSPQLPAEVTPAFRPAAPQSPAIVTTLSLSSLSNSASFSPTVTYAAPSLSSPASKHQYPPIHEPDLFQGPIPAPSAPRRARCLRSPYAGESSYRLDVVPPLQPGVPLEKPKRKTRGDKPWLACRCPDGPTKKPARHWGTNCLANPDAGQKRFRCDLEHCAETFSTKFNRERHVKEQHE